MNHRQRGVLGTAAIALIAISLFYVPWRIESNGEIAWAPFYRNPVMERATRITGDIETRFVRLKGRPVWWLYGMQLIAIVGVGGVVYWKSRDEEDGAEETEN